jgi:prepilin-type N-terminal cleavage/methylation domain-containing protein
MRNSSYQPESFQLPVSSCQLGVVAGASSRRTAGYGTPTGTEAGRYGGARPRRFPVSSFQFPVADCEPGARSEEGVCSPLVPRPSTLFSSLAPRPSSRSGFTLVELMVVLGIIILLLAIAIPAMGPLTTSNHMTEATSKVKSLLVQAQVAAVGNGTPVGIRFERAYETITSFRDKNNAPLKDSGGVTHPYDIMATSGGKPKWLNHQWAQLVIFASSNKMILDPLSGSKPMDMPANVWAAPDDALEWAKGNAPDSIGWPSTPDLKETSLIWQPTPPFPADATPVAYNRFETFVVAFGPSGELGRFPQADNRYCDAKQMYYSGAVTPKPESTAPVVQHPDGSSRGLLLYDRHSWEGLSANDSAVREEFLRQTAKPVYVNRNLGDVLQEKTQ